MIWCEVRFQFHPFKSVWLSSCSTPFVWKDYSFPIECSWHCCWRSVDHKCKGSFLNSQFFSIDTYVYSYASAKMSYLLLLCSTFWNQEAQILLCSSYLRLFWLSWVPWNSIWILESACQFTKKSAGTLMRIALNL